MYNVTPTLTAEHSYVAPLAYANGRLGTVDLLNKAAWFVTKISYNLNIKNNLSKLLSRRGSTILSLPLQ